MGIQPRLSQSGPYGYRLYQEQNWGELQKLMFKSWNKTYDILHFRHD